MVVVGFKAGARFGRLVLRQKTRMNPKVSFTIRKQWVADCDCGKRITVPEYYLVRNPNPKVNCGECVDLKTNKTLFNQEYRIWLMMLMRTTDPRHVSYKYYGQRGIIVAPEWSDPETGFDAFLKFIGPRPSEHFTVDRYPDPDGHYAPGNVRWATGSQQAANKSRLPKGQMVPQYIPATSTPQSQSETSTGVLGTESGTETPKQPPTSDGEPPKT
jgi:hypothetical protein